MSLKRKAKILLGHLLPRNKIARFIVLEFIALLISFFLFVSLSLVFYLLIYFLLLKGRTPLFGGDSLGRAFEIAGAVIASMRYSLVCSIPLGIAVHAYVFEKFFTRREKKMDENYGFSGNIPEGVSIQNNVEEGLTYQKDHSVYETIDWFYEQVKGGGIWDYKLLEVYLGEKSYVSAEYDALGVNIFGNHTFLMRALGTTE
jgi:hypothetical protein